MEISHISNCEMSRISSKSKRENHKCLPCIKGPYSHAVLCKIGKKVLFSSIARGDCEAHMR